jgi:murein DD-endopeptidase MepM/ murein hydrolase activator NlpD
LIAAVFLVAGGLLSGAWLSAHNGTALVSNAFSAPALVQTAQAQDALPAVSVVNSGTLAGPLAVIGNNTGASDFSPLTHDNGVIRDPGSPIGPTPVSESAVLQGNAAQLAGQSGAFPDFNSSFVVPVKGHDLGVLHNYNAVDIVAACGTPVIAAADGLVVPDENNPDDAGGWNGGYGNFVYLEHSFGEGIFTRYAHLSKLLVNIGDYVKQGQEIGLVGKTGDATGCHLHFEVVGAQNPFAKK